MNRFVVANARRQRIPVTIVGGPKGAGKTTLLRQLLTCNDGRRIAVALDHGIVPSLSPSLVASTSSNALDLVNGSSCLALDGDIGTALSTLHSTRDRTLPDHVVVEASASAGPLRMAGYTFLPGFRPGGMIVVVSAAEIETMNDEGVEPDSFFDAQLRHAELLVVNQMDQLRVAERPAVRRWLQDRASRARLIESQQCCVPTAMILGADLDHVPANATHAEWSPSFSVSTDSRKQRILQPRHNDDFRSWLLSSEQPIEARSFRGWVRTLPDSVLRGDGVLRILGEPSHQFRFEFCGQRWSLARDEPWGTDEAPRSWVSLVGFGSRSASSSKGRLESDDLSAAESRQAEHHFRPPLWPSPSKHSFGDHA
jgi:cobalamin biosynthesis protein CobW